MTEQPDALYDITILCNPDIVKVLILRVLTDVMFSLRTSCSHLVSSVAVLYTLIFCRVSLIESCVLCCSS